LNEREKFIFSVCWGKKQQKVLEVEMRMNKAVLESGYSTPITVGRGVKENSIVKPINTFMCRTVCVLSTPPSIIHEHLSVTKYCVLCLPYIGTYTFIFIEFEEKNVQLRAFFKEKPPS
jgi:hypothetical protein